MRKPLLNIGCGDAFHPDWVNVDLMPVDERVGRLNALDSLPFEESSFAGVYHSHVLEHLPRHEAAPFLRECWRVLRPSGVIRIAVPDLETICRLYLANLEAALAGDEAAEARYEWMVIELIDQMAREESGGEMLRHWNLRPVPARAFVLERVGRIAARYMDREPVSLPPPARPEAEALGAFRLGGEVHKWMYDRLALARLLARTGFVEITPVSAGFSRMDGFDPVGLDLEPDGHVRKPDSLFMEAIRPA